MVIIKLYKPLSIRNDLQLITGSGKLTTAHLFTFVKTNAKVYVQAPGCVKELDELAAKFVKNAAKRKEILKKAEELIGKIEAEEVNDFFN